MTIHVDKRCIQAVEQSGLDERLAAALEVLRDAQIQTARGLALADESAHFVFSGCASIVEYALRLGFGAAEARTLTNLGKTLAAAPEAEGRVRRGEITVYAASLIGRVLSCPAMLREGDDWLAAAASEPLHVLRRRVRERLELHAQGEPGLEEVSVFVSARTRDDFQRAREVASQKAGRPLTEGQTLTRVVDFYLEKNDPMRKAGGTRRLGSTGGLPGSRYIPAAVRRAVLLRADGGCEVPGCTHRLVGLQFAHRRPHALGSGREVEDIGLLCGRHHTLYDAGRIPWPVRGPDRDDNGNGSGSGSVRDRGPPFRASREARPATVQAPACPQRRPNGRFRQARRVPYGAWCVTTAGSPSGPASHAAHTQRVEVPSW